MLGHCRTPFLGHMTLRTVPCLFFLRHPRRYLERLRCTVVRIRLLEMLFVRYSEFEDALEGYFPTSRPKSSRLFCQILVAPRWGAYLSPSLSTTHPLLGSW